MKQLLKLFIVSSCSIATLYAMEHGAVGVKSGQVIYEIDPNASKSELRAFNAIIKANGQSIEKSLDKKRKRKVGSFSKAKGKEKDLAKRLRDTGAVKFAEPNYKFKAVATPNDPYVNYNGLTLHLALTPRGRQPQAIVVYS